MIDAVCPPLTAAQKFPPDISHAPHAKAKAAAEVAARGQSTERACSRVSVTGSGAGDSSRVIAPDAPGAISADAMGNLLETAAIAGFRETDRPTRPKLHQKPARRFVRYRE